MSSSAADDPKIPMLRVSTPEGGEVRVRRSASRDVLDVPGLHVVAEIRCRADRSGRGRLTAGVFGPRRWRTDDLRYTDATRDDPAPLDGPMALACRCGRLHWIDLAAVGRLCDLQARPGQRKPVQIEIDRIRIASPI